MSDPGASVAVGAVSRTGCGDGEPGRSADGDRLERLWRFLSVYWLRPENALWMTLRSLALTKCAIRPPSIDVACGDGVFAFLHAGGAFDDGFDVFGAVGHLDQVTAENADMFDAASGCYTPMIARRPDWGIDTGLDLKPELLRKAEKLGFYGQFVEHDGNTPLPLADEAIATVYCNSGYWMRAIDLFLRELRRVTRTDGNIILHVKLASMRDYTLETFREQFGRRFLRIIDRGRRESWPTVGTRGQWEERFERAGLTVVAATPFVTQTHARIWDVGLRPIAPLLVRMANALTPETRVAIKRDWVALFLDLLEPLCRPDFDLFAGKSEPAEMQYVLKRK